jgi:hypothetical protein
MLLCEIDVIKNNNLYGCYFYGVYCMIRITSLFL